MMHAEFNFYPFLLNIVSFPRILQNWFHFWTMDPKLEKSQHPTGTVCVLCYAALNAEMHQGADGAAGALECTTPGGRLELKLTGLWI